MILYQNQKHSLVYQITQLHEEIWAHATLCGNLTTLNILSTEVVISP